MLKALGYNERVVKSDFFLGKDQHYLVLLPDVVHVNEPVPALQGGQLRGLLRSSLTPAAVDSSIQSQLYLSKTKGTMFSRAYRVIPFIGSFRMIELDLIPN